MTSSERVQLEKDILYEHHKAEQDFQAELLNLRRWQERLQIAADKLKIFTQYIESAPLHKDGAPTGEASGIDSEEISRTCHESLRLREKLEQLSADKKSLGL